MEVIFFGSFVVLSLLAFFLHKILSNKNEEQEYGESLEKKSKFKKFQLRFFAAYFLALISDWLQGPYVYNLYEYYGYQEFQIAVLYTTGFASSVLFGTFTGPIADAWGRKFMAIMYCIFYTICCLTKLSSNFSMLMLGRVFGGIATSILFSTFEAWYVYEHQNNENKFPKEWISSTFSVTTFFNGLLAILAGVIANFVAETMGFGPVSPFLVALVPLILCFFIVKLTWPENYGSQVSTSLGTSCMDGFKQIFADKSILRLGIVQSSVESILYIFVFLWTPVLSPLKPPLGIIFADFMICIMIGSKIHRVLLDRYSWKEKEVLQSVCLILITSLSVGVLSMSLPSNGHSLNLLFTFFAFCILEIAFGMYFPSISYLKSQFIPESHRANIMNWFRVPLNIITCGTLLSLKSETVKGNKRLVFCFCIILALIGYLTTQKIDKNPTAEEEIEQFLIDKEGMVEVTS